jgi:hypothetical protein
MTAEVSSPRRPAFMWVAAQLVFAVARALLFIVIAMFLGARLFVRAGERVGATAGLTPQRS